jgi:hypothetical protein
MQLLTASDPQKIPSGKLYWYGLFGGAYRAFTSNNATFEQMKNAGALSYLDKGVAEDLARYDMLYRQMQAWEEKTREIFTQVRVSRARASWIRLIK